MKKEEDEEWEYRSEIQREALIDRGHSMHVSSRMRKKGTLIRKEYEMKERSKIGYYV